MPRFFRDYVCTYKQKECGFLNIDPCVQINSLEFVHFQNDCWIWFKLCKRCCTPIMLRRAAVMQHHQQGAPNLHLWNSFYEIEMNLASLTKSKLLMYLFLL